MIIINSFLFNRAHRYPWPCCWVYYYRDAKMIPVAMLAADSHPGPSAGVPRLLLSKESSFLPSLLSSTFTDL